MLRKLMQNSFIWSKLQNFLYQLTANCYVMQQPKFQALSTIETAKVTAVDMT